jgi:hypothetical protein
VNPHRDGPDSGAIEIPKGRESEAGLVVEATAASVTARACVAAFPVGQPLTEIE